jgi:hypothetical protein
LVEEFVFFFFCSALAECWTRPGRGGGGSLILSGSGISSPSFASGLSTVTFSQQLHISFLIMEAAWWSLSFCVHSFHLIVLLQDLAMSHILSNFTSLAWSWKQHMIISILYALFSSHSFALGLSSVSFSQQCHISCFIMEVAW